MLGADVDMLTVDTVFPILTLDAHATYVSLDLAKNFVVHDFYLVSTVSLVHLNITWTTLSGDCCLLNELEASITQFLFQVPVAKVATIAFTLTHQKEQ